jgi:hypothetical protein
VDVFGSAKVCVMSITWVPRLVFVFESIKACVMSITWVPVLVGCCALQIATILFFFLVITQAIHVSLLNKRQYHTSRIRKTKGGSSKRRKTKRNVEKGVLGAMEA